MMECTVKIEFDVAHRVIGHAFKCKYLHGHRYILEVTAKAEKLNHLGMVIDFGELKSIIKSWIDENFDHNVILHQDDKPLGSSISNVTGQKVYYLPSNPTAENIALHMKKDIIPLLFVDNSIKIIRVRLYETPNCYVEINE